MKTHHVSSSWKRLWRVGIVMNTVVAVTFALFFGFLPGIEVARSLRDPGLYTLTVPRTAWQVHREISPKLADWARRRVASGRASALTVANISGTEWPLFGCVFYLWATESLESAWKAGKGYGPTPPSEYARTAIEAATALVADPNHATWVTQHWGKHYLTRDNTFYRALLIAALTSYSHLTGNRRYETLLRELVDNLSRELDSSPEGLLEDYPGECYPCDVIMAVLCIRRADAVLGTDHVAFAERAKRAFGGENFDGLGLPPYLADKWSGEPVAPSRGCATSFLCSITPELWPDLAVDWYALYVRNFWQLRWGTYGFREFQKGLPGYDWFCDVDAGPSVAGHGFAACAFGVGAARANGSAAEAYPLAAEMLALSWPLPNGRLALPALLSNATDAPFLGECAILYNLTRTPLTGAVAGTQTPMPPLVYAMLLAYFAGGCLVVGAAILNVRRIRRETPVVYWAVRAQITAWALLAGTGVVCVAAGWPKFGLVMLLLAQLLPRHRSGKYVRLSNSDCTED